jgi:hypothetical protein
VHCGVPDKGVRGEGAEETWINPISLKKFQPVIKQE